VKTNILSFPEITENTGILVNPLNIKEISIAMEKIASVNELRENLINKGSNLSKRYNWRVNASEVRKIYEKFNRR
jgi:glycosyltransferase involved in cell wall biosynthesis